MLIQLVLIIILVFIFLYSVKNLNSTKVRAYKKLGLIVFVALAIFSVIFPEVLNSIAHYLGVGRGADLLLYLTIVSVVFLAINLYIKFKEVEVKINKIARKVVVIEGLNSEVNNKE